VFFDPIAEGRKLESIHWDTDRERLWESSVGRLGRAVAGREPQLPAGVSMTLDTSRALRELRWPEGVPRYSYRRQPALPFGYSGDRKDNVQLAFHVLDAEGKGVERTLPGRPPRFISYPTTDYQFALHHVAPQHGGGTEVWRLDAPTMPRQHFYPRQPQHPLGGPVDAAQLVVRYEAGFRIVEASIPWSAMPHVKQRYDDSEPIKFSFLVNHDDGGPPMELAKDRSAAVGMSSSFHPDWQASWPNELVFSWEAPR